MLLLLLSQLTLTHHPNLTGFDILHIFSAFTGQSAVYNVLPDRKQLRGRNSTNDFSLFSGKSAGFYKHISSWKVTIILGITFPFDIELSV